TGIGGTKRREPVVPLVASGEQNGGRRAFVKRARTCEKSARQGHGSPHRSSLLRSRRAAPAARRTGSPGCRAASSGGRTGGCRRGPGPLRLLGVTALFAVVAVFMPVSWRAAAHRWLGLGEMPTGPVAEYLARPVSAFYAILGALCLVVAADPER